MSAKLTIETLQQAAKAKNGQLLSTTYINITTKYKWRCSNGHEWDAVASPILKSAVWCPYCGGTKKKDIASVIDSGLSLGFILLSDAEEYKNNKSKLHWHCMSGHDFFSRTNDILSGYGCPVCAGLSKPLISDLQDYARIRQGELLSTEYVNSDTKYVWRCNEGHTWTATWHSIKGGKCWCPACKSFKMESACRDIFESIFSKPFNKVRCIPYLSKYSVLELDGYNKDLGLAFEYNGVQHYKYSSWWHSTKQAFIDQQTRDIYKKDWCAHNNIRLVIIPYTENNNLEHYIRKELQQC